MEEEGAFGGDGVFYLGVRDFLLEHLVDHREGGVQKEDGIDEVLLLFVEPGVARCVGLRDDVVAPLLQGVNEAELVLHVLQVCQRLRFVVVDFFDERKHVGVVDERVAVSDRARDDELVCLLDVADFFFYVFDVASHLVDEQHFGFLTLLVDLVDFVATGFGEPLVALLLLLFAVRTRDVDDLFVLVPLAEQVVCRENGVAEQEDVARLEFDVGLQLVVLVRGYLVCFGRRVQFQIVDDGQEECDEG